MNSSVTYHKLKEIPENSYVFRHRGTNSYIHLAKTHFLFKNQMIGCLVLTKSTAEQIYATFSQTEIDTIEMVEFKEAYQQHGLLERQMACN